MESVFIVLAVAGYFGFLIDWKELRDVLKQGGWAALAFYCLIGIFIVAAMAAPHAASVPAVPH
jgi:hypothetical protein